MAQIPLINIDTCKYGLLVLTAIMVESLLVQDEIDHTAPGKEPVFAPGTEPEETIMVEPGVPPITIKMLSNEWTGKTLLELVKWSYPEDPEYQLAYYLNILVRSQLIKFDDFAKFKIMDYFNGTPRVTTCSFDLQQAKQNAPHPNFIVPEDTLSDLYCIK
jgi:hypothetical protein